MVASATQPAPLRFAPVVFVRISPPAGSPFYDALPLGVESLAETMDVELAAPVPETTLVSTLNRVLPPGLKVLQARRLTRRLGPARARRGGLRGGESGPGVRARRRGGLFGSRRIHGDPTPAEEDQRLDLRGLVARLTILDPLRLGLDLRRQAQGNFKVTDALAAIFHPCATTRPGRLRIVKIKGT